MEKKTILFLVWLVMNYVDFFVTAYALHHGFTEQNPLYHLNPAFHTVMKIAIIPLCIYAVHGIMKVWGFYILIIAYALVLFNNFYWLAAATY